MGCGVTKVRPEKNYGFNTLGRPDFHRKVVYVIFRSGKKKRRINIEVNKYSPNRKEQGKGDRGYWICYRCYKVKAPEKGFRNKETF